MPADRQQIKWLINDNVKSTTFQIALDNASRNQLVKFMQHLDKTPGKQKVRRDLVFRQIRRIDKDAKRAEKLEQREARKRGKDGSAMVSDSV